MRIEQLNLCKETFNATHPTRCKPQHVTVGQQCSNLTSQASSFVRFGWYSNDLKAYLDTRCSVATWSYHAASCSLLLRVPLSNLTPSLVRLPPSGTSARPRTIVQKRESRDSLFMLRSNPSTLSRSCWERPRRRSSSNLTVNKHPVSHVRIRDDSCFDCHVR